MTDMRGGVSSLSEIVCPEQSAVIVIDMQNDFVAQGGWADTIGRDVRQGQRAAERLRKFLPVARAHRVPVIFVRSICDDIYMSDPQMARSHRLGISADRCLSGTWGAEFFMVEPESDEAVITKHTYSAFAGTDLLQVLRRLRTKTVILGGIYTDGCVESSGRDAFGNGYFTVMLSDGCADRSERDNLDALARCERLFCSLASSQDIVSAWGAAHVSEVLDRSC